MDFTIKALTPELVGDFLDFFDNDAFADHQDWSWCYCLECYLCKADNGALDSKEARRAKAAELITAGSFNGYLAYADERVVGWCNAGDKDKYAGLREKFELLDKDYNDRNAVSVVCFITAEGYRGKGCASLLLERVLADAAAKGRDYVEAYPAKGGKNCYEEYHGPSGLYSKQGFTLYKDMERRQVVRKYI